MAHYKYTVIFEPLEEGGYNVVVPALPDICTFGETLEEARAMAADAITCSLEGRLKLGKPIPENGIINRDPVKEEISVSL